jgi:hypothetical protein
MPIQQPDDTKQGVKKAPTNRENPGNAYPEAEERGQRSAEEALLHFLYEERLREALMAVRSLQSWSGSYVEKVTPILEGTAAEPVHERTLKHVDRSIQFQDGMMLYARRRSTFLPQGNRERDLLMEIVSVLVACRHRNDLIRRLLLVSTGHRISRVRNPGADDVPMPGGRK